MTVRAARIAPPVAPPPDRDLVELRARLDAVAERLGVAPMWTPEDVATYLRLEDVRAVYELSRRRARHPLPALRVGRYLRFRREDVIAWCDALRTGRARTP